MKHQVKSRIISNVNIQGDYHRIDFEMGEVALEAQPGQFIHLQIPGMEGHLLRRPFSIFDADAASGRVSVIYKVVGKGTEHLKCLEAGRIVDVCGPLGRPFSPLPEAAVIVAGGYGCAATHLLAKNAERKPVVLIGGRSSIDVLLVEEYSALGCDVRVATNDGSLGTAGFVTALLDGIETRWIAACGPIPMLKSLAKLMGERGIDGELSLDKAMCCGVGACFACVTKIKADNGDGWEYARVCSDGPVFRASDIVWN